MSDDTPTKPTPSPDPAGRVGTIITAVVAFVALLSGQNPTALFCGGDVVLLDSELEPIPLDGRQTELVLGDGEAAFLMRGSARILKIVHDPQEPSEPLIDRIQVEESAPTPPIDPARRRP